MMIPPEIPALTTPVVSAVLQNLNAPTVPIISPGQWNKYPTALSSSDLVPGGTVAEQTQALYQLVLQASRMADVECFGSLPFGAPPGFSARYVTEVRQANVISGAVRLYCRQQPILQFTNYGFAIGGGLISPVENLSTIGPTISRRTITVPLAGAQFPVVSSSQSGRVFPQIYEGVEVTSYYTYLGGYIHTALASAATAGDTSITVLPNASNGTIAGISPNRILTINDTTNGLEQVMITGISGNTLTLSAPLQYAHPLPEAPDFIPVTEIDPRVQEAVIYFTSCAVLNRGDMSLVLNTLAAPSSVSGDNGQTAQLYAVACDKLAPWKQLMA